jgi:hypothetical protein
MPRHSTVRTVAIVGESTGIALWVTGMVLRLTGKITVDLVTVIFGIAAALNLTGQFVRWRIRKAAHGQS